MNVGLVLKDSSVLRDQKLIPHVILVTFVLKDLLNNKHAPQEHSVQQ
jgi:hypothetical protein